MDVKRLVLVCGFFLLAACDNKPKDKESVFTNTAASECPGQTNDKRYIVEWENGETTVEESTSLEDFKNGFVSDNLNKIKRVHLDQTVELLQNNNSFDLNAFVDSQSWGQDIVKADDVWAQNISGEGIRVGVVDSFVDTQHVQLKSRIDYNTKEIPNNGEDDDGNGYVDDYAGMSFAPPSTKISPHGSHVSGIILADSTLGPTKGMAPKALLVPAPFISDTAGSLADAVNALNYVASRNVRIINASWGGSRCVVNALKSTFENLNARGILVVVAAGNDGKDLDQSADYPASFNMPNQITVAASTVLDYMSSWSNSSFNFVHIAAPGESIYSTTPGNTYQSFQGTSMAAPFVSGAAALLMSAVPRATAYQIKDALIRSADVVPAHEFRVQSRGRLNVKKALDYLRSIGL